MGVIWRIYRIKAKKEEQRVKELYRLKMNCGYLDSEFEKDPFILEIKYRLKLNLLCTADYKGWASPIDVNDSDRMIYGRAVMEYRNELTLFTT
jgi:hypothetical protein